MSVNFAHSLSWIDEAEELRLREEAFVLPPLLQLRQLTSFAFYIPLVAHGKERQPHIKRPHHVDVQSRPDEMEDATKLEGEITTMMTTKRKRTMRMTPEAVLDEAREVVQRTTVMTKRSQKRRTGDQGRRPRQETRVRGINDPNLRSRTMKTRTNRCLAYNLELDQ